MGYPTAIEWTDATWNPVGGCEIKSPGCINCYAQSLAGGPRLRNHPLYAGTTDQVNGKSVFNGLMTALPEDHQGWTWPLRWRGAAEPKLGKGNPSLIFVGDMADLCHRDRPIQHVNRTVAAVIYSRHIGQLLTKRPDVMVDYFESLRTTGSWYMWDHPLFKEPNFDASVADFENSVMPRLWLGCSVERQAEANERLPHLRKLAEAGWQTFISIEPLLGPIMLPTWLSKVTRKPWIIVGGESGPSARPMHPYWADELLKQASAFGLPFFFKQWGEFAPDGPRGKPSTLVGEGLSQYRMVRIGKKTAGRIFDGREYSQFPEAA